MQPTREAIAHAAWCMERAWEFCNTFPDFRGNHIITQRPSHEWFWLESERVLRQRG